MATLNIFLMTQYR